MKQSAKILSTGSWLITMLVVMPAVAAWYSGLYSGLENLSGYQLFPLFGLLAFTLMLSHYLVASLRLLMGLDKSITRSFTEITGWIVLGAIILHPTILVFNLWRDGLGLPPASYLNNYVLPDLKWAVAIGSLAFMAFMAYELRRWFAEKSWWVYIQTLSDIAMVLILVHGFKLGSNLQTGWFKSVWLVYAVGLVVSLGVIYFYKFKPDRSMIG